MTSLGKSLAKYGFTYRKRHLDVDIMCPAENLMDWNNTLIITERRMCKFDENTKIVTMIVKGKGQPKKEVSYYAPQYWKYYWTDERPRLLSSQVGKAIMQGR